MFANEVIDALPTPRFAIDAGEVYEEHVAIEAEALVPCCRRPMVSCPMPCAISSASSAQLRNRLPLRGAATLPYWLQAVSGGMRRGAMLFVDYGYARGEYYLPERSDGTLRAYYRRHRMHGDPLLWPGLQDLTSSVDFTALAEAGVAAGFDFAGYCSQASFLLGNGLAGVLERIEQIADEGERLRRTQEVKRLTLPSEMGERFQAMGFQKDVEFGAAFLAGDLSFRL